jgi:regulator of protease activity HflC (stomatin/prohibitin superfamily)
VAQLPVEDVETTFMLGERSADFQEVAVQVTLTYRVVDPQKAAQRVNFSISLDSGVWIEQPLQRLANLWAHWSRHLVRASVMAMAVADLLHAGPDRTRAALEEALRDNAEIAEMGLALVSVQVDRVTPAPEVEKALQTPTREAIQQKADEATFQRRALAVEKERAIKENELATEIELARRQEDLIRRQGDNQMLAVRQETERQRLNVEAEAERNQIAANGQAQAIRVRAEAEAEARRKMMEVEAEAETRRVEAWKDAPPSVTFGLAAQRFADKVQTIQHLNLTPDLVGDTLKRMLLGEGGPAT